jgi:rSAM/selenodomain-associated transferase 1
VGCRIIIFAKAPVAGEVKTRLAPLLGLEGAAALARRLLHATCEEAQAVLEAEVELCTSPSPEDPSWSGLLPAGIRVTAQGEGELGTRLARAAARTIDEGDRPILIGTDCPALGRARLSTACRMLGQYDAVLHPTEDGGYALLGLNAFSALLFTDIGWSGPEVASQTLARLDCLGWRCWTGEVLRDIDEPQDYEAVFGAK